MEFFRDWGFWKICFIKLVVLSHRIIKGLFYQCCQGLTLEPCSLLRRCSRQFGRGSSSHLQAQTSQNLPSQHLYAKVLGSGQAVRMLKDRQARKCFTTQPELDLKMLAWRWFGWVLWLSTDRSSLPTYSDQLEKSVPYYLGYISRFQDWF